MFGIECLGGSTNIVLRNLFGVQLNKYFPGRDHIGTGNSFADFGFYGKFNLLGCKLYQRLLFKIPLKHSDKLHTGIKTSSYVEIP
jgi:hypothetical protein